MGRLCKAVGHPVGSGGGVCHPVLAGAVNLPYSGLFHERSGIGGIDAASGQDFYAVSIRRLKSTKQSLSLDSLWFQVLS